MGNWLSNNVLVEEESENEEVDLPDQLRMMQAFSFVINAKNFDFRECVPLELVSKTFYQLVQVNCLSRFKKLDLKQVLRLPYVNPDKLAMRVKESLFQKVLKCRNLEEIHWLNCIFNEIDSSHLTQMLCLKKLHTIKDCSFARSDDLKRFLNGATSVDSLAIRLSPNESGEYESSAAEILEGRPWKKLWFYVASEHWPNRLYRRFFSSIDPNILTELAICIPTYDYGFSCTIIGTAAFVSFLKSCTALETLNFYLAHNNECSCPSWLKHLKECPKLSAFLFAGHCFWLSYSVFEALADCRNLKIASHKFVTSAETIHLFADREPANLMALTIWSMRPPDHFSLKKIRNLKKLDINCCPEVLRGDMFPDGLEELTIKNNVFIDDSLENLNDMKNLRILKWSEAGSQFLPVCQKIGPQLEKLSVTIEPEILSDSLNAIAECCPNLTELQIYAHAGSDESLPYICQIAENCNKLIAVKLMIFSESFQPDEDTVGAFMNHCQHLRYLKVNKEVDEVVKQELEKYKPRLIFGDWDGFGVFIEN